MSTVGNLALANQETYGAVARDVWRVVQYETGNLSGLGDDEGWRYVAGTRRFGYTR